jgi:hypothetical protein
MASNSLNYNAIEKLPDRFWHKINKTDSCWLWMGKIDDGYGRFFINGKHYLVHRMAYAVLKNKLQENTQVDHLCKVRNCINPDHLEEVTSKENTRRGLSGKFNTDPNKCPYGHDYDYLLEGKAKGSVYLSCNKCKYLKAKNSK